MTQNFTIIRANSTYIEIVAPLFDRYRQFYGQPGNLEASRYFLDERLNNNESVVFLAIAEDNNTPVGLGFTQMYPLFSSVAMKPIWILNDLFVIPQKRKQGIATALLEKAKEFAIETKAEGLRLSTGIDNHLAQKLYGRLGYKRDEAFYHYYLDL